MTHETGELDEYGIPHFTSSRPGLHGIMRLGDVPSEDLAALLAMSEEGEFPDVVWTRNSILAWLTACRPRQMRDMFRAIDRELRRRDLGVSK